MSSQNKLKTPISSSAKHAALLLGSYASTCTTIQANSRACPGGRILPGEVEATLPSSKAAFIAVVLRSFAAWKLRFHPLREKKMAGVFFAELGRGILPVRQSPVFRETKLYQVPDGGSAESTIFLARLVLRPEHAHRNNDSGDCVRLCSS